MEDRWNGLTRHSSAGEGLHGQRKWPHLAVTKDSLGVNGFSAVGVGHEHVCVVLDSHRWNQRYELWNAMEPPSGTVMVKDIGVGAVGYNHNCAILDESLGDGALFLRWATVPRKHDTHLFVEERWNQPSGTVMART